LNEFDTDDELTEPTLLEELGWAVRGGGAIQMTIEQLRTQGKASETLELLRTALCEPEPIARATACLGMEYLADPAAVAVLKPMLGDPDPLVVVRAAAALDSFGEPASTLIPRMREILRLPEPPLPQGRQRITSQCAYLQLPEAHYHAARILGWFGVEAASAREDLVKALESCSAMVRAEAAQALAGMGEPKETYLPPLHEALKDTAVQSPRERVSAAEALVELGEQPASIIPAIIDLVQDEDWTTAGRAIHLLGEWGERAIDAVPALRAAQTCGRQDIADEAASTLARIAERLRRPL